MCGVAGILGREDAVQAVLEGLSRVEYRGYDSAGIISHDGAGLKRVRAVGRLAALRDALTREPLSGHLALGHTRWATHGGVTEANAHPHTAGRVGMICNGIVENERLLRAELSGANWSSETDTEVLAALLARAYEETGDPLQAWYAISGQVEGAFAFAAVFEDRPAEILAVRRGCPLLVGFAGHGEGAVISIGSDLLALAGLAERAIPLEDGDAAVLTLKGADIRDGAGEAVERASLPVALSPALAEKGPYRHFMAKEIFEQPEALARTLGPLLDAGRGITRPAPQALVEATHLTLLACGTARYAGMIGAQAFEHWAGLPARAEIASEFRARPGLSMKDQAALAVSQSGETADTLAALRIAAQQGASTGALVNVDTSTMAREAGWTLTTHAGPEIGVASTKAFTAQIAALMALALATGRARGSLDEASERAAVADLLAAPRLMSEALKQAQAVRAVAQKMAEARDVLFLGRGVSYALALEGALKLKEISYIHAAGHAAGEMKHGPIALVDEHVPVVVVAPRDQVFAKTLANAQEAAARGGKIIMLSDAQGLKEAGDMAWQHLEIPDAPALVQPLVAALPLQLLAYEVALMKGTDIDRPRNLAKSVTVE